MITDQLRIGNWFSNDEKYFTLDTSSILDAITNEKIKPIALTPEILEKCGFQKKSNSEWFDNYWNDIKYGIVHCIKDEPHGGFIAGKFYCGILQIEIPSLHWLQNHYYFSIAPGTELTINL